MKTRPILFSAPMVRAILEGRKTQTRRVVKNSDVEFFDCGDARDAVITFCEAGHSGPGFYVHCSEYQDEGSQNVACPYGQPGDRLWVRETFCHWPEERAGDFGEVLAQPAQTLYRASPLRNSWSGTGNPEDAWSPGMRWRPSIFMPRHLSRITLEITEVRVQRLQGISEEDAMAEGVAFDPQNAFGTFRHLWDSINSERAPWDSNPWVWALTFKRVEVANG